MQLVSKISNLCDPDPPTSQTDGQTDRQTDDMQSQYRANALHRAVKTSEFCVYKQAQYVHTSEASRNVLWTRNWRTLLHIHLSDAAFALTPGIDGLTENVGRENDGPICRT